MKLMITGVSGFLGTRLAEISLERGFEVIGVSRGEPNGRLVSPMPLKDLHLLKADLNDTDAVSAIFAKYRPDAVLHAAARVARTLDDDDPIAFFRDNTQATLNLLYHARKSGVKHVVFISTMHVYKVPPVYLPVNEQHPIEPLNSYGVSKLAAELYCKQFASAGMSVTILRCSGIYGRGQQKSGAIPKFIYSCLQSEPIYLDSGGRQTNDFVWVDDVVEACLLSLKPSGAFYRIFNIGSGVELSIKSLVETIRSACLSDSKICVSDKMSAYNFNFILDINKAKEQLGFSPTPPEKALGYFVKQLSQGEM